MIYEEWTYEGILGAGSTSYVFSGTLKGLNVALKWVKAKEGVKEIDVVKELETCKSKNLLLPFVYDCGDFTLDQIVGKENVTSFVQRAKLMNGPGLVKNVKTNTVRLKGSNKGSCVLVFPIMTGSLDTQNLEDHDSKDIIKNITSAVTCLKDIGWYHDDLALRNIYFQVTPSQKPTYFLGDFGKMIQTSDYKILDIVKYLTSTLK